MDKKQVTFKLFGLTAKCPIKNCGGADTVHGHLIIVNGPLSLPCPSKNFAKALLPTLEKLSGIKLSPTERQMIDAEINASILPEKETTAEEKRIVQALLNRRN